MLFYKRDPDAALAGMSELTLEERGAYNSILDLLYSRDGDVPDDDRLIARMISCHWRTWVALRKRLTERGKIWSEGGRITAKRVQETLKQASELSQKQRNKASKRWQKTENDSENNEAPMPPGNASISISTSTSNTRAPKKEESEEDPRFIEFYLSYPKKKAKRAAAKAYAAALRHASHDEIMAGLANAKKSDQRFRDSKFTPFPASWLNSGGYADEVEIVRHSINDPYAGIE